MAIRKILKYGNPEEQKILLTPSIPFDFNGDLSVDEILEDMWDTLYSEDTAIALSAVQIDISYRIFIMLYAGKRREFINPVILKKSNDMIIDFKEGCLSHPGIERGRRRHKTIMLKWYNRKGKVRTKKLTGLEALAAQHEFDHFNGKDCLFADIRELFDEDRKSKKGKAL